MVESGVEGRRGEEAVVEVRAFEDGVDEEVEGMPDEEDAKTRGSVGGENALGEDEGGIEKEEHRAERGEGCAVDVVHY
jgi:hypothetical protein